MALLLIALFVLVPLALLVVDLVRSGRAMKETPHAGPSYATALGGQGETTRGPRPNWPAKPAKPARAPRRAATQSSYRPTGGRHDYFGDGTLDRA